jgi:hypothetical protein
VLQLLEDAAVDTTETYSTFADVAATDDIYTKASVAELSRDRITRMSCGELARAIRDVSALQFCNESRLDYLDRSTLERLLYLARQCCRNQGY